MDDKDRSFVRISELLLFRRSVIRNKFCLLRLCSASADLTLRKYENISDLLLALFARADPFGDVHARDFQAILPTMESPTLARFASIWP